MYLMIFDVNFYRNPRLPAVLRAETPKITQNHGFRHGQQMVDNYAGKAPNCSNYRVLANLLYTLLNRVLTFEKLQ